MGGRNNGFYDRRQDPLQSIWKNSFYEIEDIVF